MTTIEYIPSFMIHKRRKTYNIYKPKVIVASDSSISRIIGHLETRDENEAKAEAEKLIQKLKEAK